MENYDDSSERKSLLIDVCLIDSFDKLMLAIDLSLKARDAMKQTIYYLEAEMDGHYVTKEDYLELKQAELIHYELNQNVIALKNYFALATQLEKVAKEAKNT